MIDLISVALAFAIVCAAPGPANLALAARAMSAGRAAAIPMALGLALGLALWGAVAASGFGAVLAASSTALVTLKLIGAAYLLWLAFRAAQGARRVDMPAVVAPARGGFASGLLLNLSNPKAVLAWLAALAVGMAPGSGVAGVLAPALVCALIGLGNYLAWALLFSCPAAMAFYANGRRRIDAACAALFALAAFGLVRSVWSR